MTGPEPSGLPPGIGPEDLPQTPFEWFLFSIFMADLERNGLPRDPQEEQRRIRRCEQIAAHYWPLMHYKLRGIEMGRQWDVLGRLAARYARDFTIADLADELWKLMEASPQRHGYGPDGPWTMRHAVEIASRAHRFIERADEKQDRMLRESGAYSWAASTERWARSQPRPRQARQPGTRPSRKPGRAS